ncbi:MAG: threonine-phosphate decarboxylase CobD [Gammaproteobacteria bacterium]
MPDPFPGRETGRALRVPLRELAEPATDGGLHHGGRLREAAMRYDMPLADWLDLSTGINPNRWPVPEVPPSCWSRLPEDDDGLERAARDYYDAEHALPVAGSQAAIQALPRLRPPSRVAVLDPGYAEHACAWRRAGHEVSAAAAENVDEAVRDSDVLVLIHPNNPTGARFPADRLLAWHRRLAARGGWLIVDEAFMDVTPEHSLCPFSAREGLIVLRSLGKFFGLAGARVGFVCAHPALLMRLHTLLGPWTVNGPARRVATAALNDRAWQADTRRRLLAEGARLRALLAHHRLEPEGGCALFQWLRTPHAEPLYEALARHGILTRLFTEPASLRFGLPGAEAHWVRLDSVLTQTTVTDSARAVS